MNQICPALFIKTENPNAFIGIEPLNGQHYKSGFNELFIGIYDKTKLQTDYDGPFPEWHNYEKLGFHFGNIKETLSEILPNTKKREEIKEQIVNNILTYIKKG